MRATHNEIELDLVVAARSELADRVCGIGLRRPDGAPLPDWAPGSHIDLELSPGLTRQFSLYGDRSDPSTWWVAVLLEEASRGGSAFVHGELHPGSPVRVRGPRNLFPLEDADSYLFVAGGIGITPLVPMIEEVAAGGAPWRLLYGGRQRASMAFVDDLVARYGDRVRVEPEDEYGLLPLGGVLASHTEPGCATYCCGPESLIRAVETLHDDVAHGSLHVERFSPKEQSAGKPDSFEVEAARSGLTVTVDAETSILAALRQAGVGLLSSCEEGICGTCELSVLSGVPEHRDSILTDEERELSQTMFVCVSRSLSKRLVLDA